MKKIIAIFAAAFCLTLTGCGDSASTSGNNSASTPAPSADSADLSAKTAAFKDAVTLPEMVNVTADTLGDRYNISAEDVAEFSAYICGSGAMPDEFGVFRAVDGDAANRISQALNKRVENQRSTYKDYTPGEMYKFDDCFVEVDGLVVVYAISEDNSKAREMLK